MATSNLLLKESASKFAECRFGIQCGWSAVDDAQKWRGSLSVQAAVIVFCFNEKDAEEVKMRRSTKVEKSKFPKCD